MRVIIAPVAQKDFKRLPQREKEKIKKKLTFLEKNPLGGKKLSGELTQLRSLRSWPYRILYYIDRDQQAVYITSILHRQGAYK